MYQASYLKGLFTSVISETERGREREKPQPLISAFTVIEAELSIHSPALSDVLVRKVVPGSVRRTGLGSSGEAKESVLIVL